MASTPPAEISDEEADAMWIEFQTDVNDMFLDLRLTINKEWDTKITL